LTNLDDRIFYFEKCPRDAPKADCKGLAKAEGSEDVDVAS